MSNYGLRQQLLFNASNFRSGYVWMRIVMLEDITKCTKSTTILELCAVLIIYQKVLRFWNPGDPHSFRSRWTYGAMSDMLL